MKKNLLFGMLLTFLLIGCGEKIPTISKTEKEKMIMAKDEATQKKVVEIIDELKKLKEEGNKKASKELAEWQEVKLEQIEKKADKYIKSKKLW